LAFLPSSGTSLVLQDLSEIMDRITCLQGGLEEALEGKSR